MRHELPGARMLITGAGSGIGRLMAMKAAARGARLVVWDLDEAAALAVRAEIRAAGGACEAFTVDVSDRAAVAETAVAVGEIDILVNNAGIVTGKRLLEASEEHIERTFGVNTLAGYWTARAFLPGMLARDRGAVVTVASAAGLAGVARQTDYSASKFAAFGFAESLRAELAEDGSRVDSLVVCPYYVDTGMFEGVRSRYPRLLPILEQGEVAERILRAIHDGQQLLVMPRSARYLVSAARLLPTPLFDGVMNALGINDSMDAFTGRGRPAGQAS